MLAAQPVTPVIVKVVPEPTPQVGAADVILDSLGLVGVIVIAALAVGGLLGAVLIGIKRWREARHGGALPSDHTPLDLSSPHR
ncbi:MAG TPA: hypothetical protein PLE61_12920 [Vicinamibacterales bacterium]|nr:hypothetical protein [Vicinamibacterales bacterium]HPW21702.1 hypothetical protein [Vicinamibacterales bacterium]